MAKQYAQFQFSGVNISAAGDIFPARIPITGKIVRIVVWSKSGEPNAAGDSIFNFNLNGGDLFSGADRLKIAANAEKGELSALAIDVTEGDWMLVQIEAVPAGVVKTPLTVLFVIDDEINDGLPEGGMIGWHLVKTSPADFACQWELPVINYPSSDGINEGATNLYFTNGRAQAALAAQLAAKQNSLGFTPENAANKNVANGYVGLGVDLKIAAAYLPSYVDDVLEFANFSAFPSPGETGKIYIADDTGFEYRWTGSNYLRIVASPGTTDEVPESGAPTNKYFTETRVFASAMSSLAAGVAQVIANGDSLKTMLQNLQAQISANASALANKLTKNSAISPGTATKVTFDANGLITASGATTASDIGLGAVTNNAQLIRAANDFSTFTEKTTLADDDLILIEDSAASGVKKRVKKSNLLAGLGGATSNGFSFFSPDAPYAAPSAYDDEFTGATLNAKWTFRRPTGTGTDDVFNFTKTPSILQVSIPNGSASFGYRSITQAISMAADWIFVAKLGASVFAANYAVGLMVGDGATGANAAGFAFQSTGATPASSISLLKRPILGTAVTSANVATTITLPFLYLKLRRDSAGDNFYFSFSYDGVTYSSETALWGATKPAMTEVGIFWTASQAPNASYIDWFRKVDASGQTGRLITI